MGRIRLAAGVLVLSFAAGCSGGRAPAEPARTAAAPVEPAAVPSPSPSTSPLAAPTATPDATEAAVLAAYAAYWDAILAANDPPDPFAPGLREHATGAAFEAVFETTQANKVANRAVRLPEGSVYAHRAEVTAVEGDRASVRDCAVDDAIVVQLDTGEVLDADVVTRLSTATLALEGGVWKVADSAVEQVWEGVSGCAG
jgi:hypothetical protein